MDTAQWPQGIGVVKPMESSSSKAMLEKKARPQKDQNVNCPRCNSTNTKFCYYNNYSLSQPRYFCKTCRRYWTEGGSLRNVPVGGGSRKNKRSSQSNNAPPKKITDLTSQSFPTQSPRTMHEGMQDLNLAYPPSTTDNDMHHQHDLNSISKLVEVPFNATSGLMSSFMSMPITDSSTLYSAGFPMQDFKPSLNFNLDGFDGGYGSLHGVQDRARMLFPVEDMKDNDPISTEGDEHDRGGQGDSSGFWNGVLGGGSW